MRSLQRSALLIVAIAAVIVLAGQGRSQDAPVSVATSGICVDAAGNRRFEEIRLVYHSELGYRLRATPTPDARRAAVGDPTGVFAALVACAPPHPESRRILESRTGRQQFDCHAWFSVFQFNGMWLGGPTWDLEGWKPARLHPILWWLTRCN